MVARPASAAFVLMHSKKMQNWSFALVSNPVGHINIHLFARLLPRKKVETD
jgi:hypothetical protein